MRILLAILLALAITGCGRGPAREKMHTEKAGPILKIAVYSDGRLTVNGAPSTIESLRESLRNLGNEHGVVWYYRESANQEPSPIATEVIQEVIKAQVPIRLSTKPDYSDAVAHK